MGNCMRNANREIVVQKQKYNKNVHKKYGWRGGILVERAEKGVEGHFQTAFTLDKDEKYEKVDGGEENTENRIPAVLDLVEETGGENEVIQENLV